GKKLRRAFYALRNFAALGRRHTDVSSLVEELLSNRVGEYRTSLERQHHLISDPETMLDARTLAFRLDSALRYERPVSIPRMGGAEIPVKAMLHGLGIRTVRIDGGLNGGLNGGHNGGTDGGHDGGLNDGTSGG